MKQQPSSLEGLCHKKKKIDAEFLSLQGEGGDNQPSNGRLITLDHFHKEGSVL